MDAPTPCQVRCRHCALAYVDKGPANYCGERPGMEQQDVAHFIQQENELRSKSRGKNASHDKTICKYCRQRRRRRRHQTSAPDHEAGGDGDYHPVANDRHVSHVRRLMVRWLARTPPPCPALGLIKRNLRFHCGGQHGKAQSSRGGEAQTTASREGESCAYIA